MSLTLFNLKKEHIVLIKNLEFGLTQDVKLLSVGDKSIFGGDDVYEDMNRIIYGESENDNPFEKNPIEPEKISLFDKLLSELPTALSIMFWVGGFETGCYGMFGTSKPDWKKVPDWCESEC